MYVHCIYINVCVCVCVCVRFLRDADWVLVMEEGRVDEQHSGPPDQVLPWLDQQHTNICTGPSVNGGDEHSREEGSGLEGGERRGERGRKVSTHTKPSERASTAALDSTIDPVSPAEQVSPSHPTGSGVGSSREHALVQEEEREVGVVAVSVYFAYWAAVGSILAPAIFLALFLMQGTMYGILHARLTQMAGLSMLGSHDLFLHIIFVHVYTCTCTCTSTLRLVLFVLL